MDRKNATASRECKALRVAETKVMQTVEFKDFCRESLGMAPNDFMAQECAKVTASISEAAVSTWIWALERAKRREGGEHSFIILNACNSMGVTNGSASILAILELGLVDPVQIRTEKFRYRG